MGEHPFYRFFRRIALPVERKLWRKVPRHPLFKHEYWKGELRWTPRLKTCDIYLDLDAWQPPRPEERPPWSQELHLRRLGEDDWAELPQLYCAASIQWPPLSQWGGPAASRASRCIIEWVRAGKDGPLIPEACFVAEDHAATGEKSSLAGAALVVFVPVGRLAGAPATDAAQLPHLDWIFVPWAEQRRGVATHLLGAVVQELRGLGQRTLASTVLAGHTPAMLWHWRNGFRLPRSRRL